VGNFHVATGSHVPLAEATSKWVAKRRAEGSAVHPKYPRFIHNQFRPAPLEPLLLPVGGVALVHAKLAHRRGFNESDDVRYMAIFRVSAREHSQAAHDQSCEPFHACNYPGLQ